MLICTFVTLQIIYDRRFRILRRSLEGPSLLSRLLGKWKQEICRFKACLGYKCSGPSMEPTIQNSDIVFAENLSRHFYGIQRGDIVIAKSPCDPKSNICKRVIGLEGDKILNTGTSDIFKNRSYVPTGHVWLEGDNLQNSTDSRYYGPIPYGLIRGRIFFKIWPFSDFGFLRDSPNGDRFSDD
ncbi:hypothetical protein NN561_009441 [Cricetulus griseus]